MKFSKLTAALLAFVLAFSLAACSANQNNKDDAAADKSDIETLMKTEPGNADEAAELYEKLMQKENDILSADSALWDKVFLSVNKNSPLIENCTNYGDFLLAAIDGCKDTFSKEELETVTAGANQIKEIEEKLTALEQQYPSCGSQPIEGDSVDAETAGMGNNESKLEKFPSFQGKDFDGNDVDSSTLFSGNTVTVVNFWFSTCKPCVEELGDLDALNKELAEKGGEVVGVNSYTLDGDETAISDAKDILSKKGATYRNIWFGSDTEAGQFTAGLFSFPTTYVVDQNGNIVGQPIMGGITSADQKDALNKLIDQALANSAE